MPLANKNQVGQVAEMATGTLAAGRQAANEAAMMRNAQAARASGLFQDAARPRGIIGTVVGTLSTGIGLIGTALAMPFLIKGPLKLLSKVKPLEALTSKAGAVFELRNVAVKDIPAQAAALGEKTVERIASSQKSGLLSYANNTLGRKPGIGRSALEGIKHANVGMVVMNSAFAVQQSAGIVMSLKDKAKVIRQMEKDISGKDVSMLSIMMGGASLNPIVQQARKEAFGGRSLVSTAAQVAGVAGNVYLAIFDKSQGAKAFAKSLAMQFGPDLLAKGLDSGNTALQSYRAMTLSMAQTGKASVDMYEGLIGGLAQDAPGELVRQVAEKAYLKQMAPGDVLKMMSETDFMKNPQSRSFVAAEMARRNAAGKGGVALAGA